MKQNDVTTPSTPNPSDPDDRKFGLSVIIALLLWLLIMVSMTGALSHP